MRTMTVLVAIALTLSSCATIASIDTSRADQNTYRAKIELLHLPVRVNGLVGTLVVPDTSQAYPGVLRLGGGKVAPRQVTPRPSPRKGMRYSPSLTSALRGFQMI